MMNDASNDEGVLPHGDLVEIGGAGSGLWQLTGTLANLALPRNMAVARLGDGRLWIHSAIAVREATAKALEALGEPAWIVAPSVHHTIDARRLKARWPKAKLVAPAAARATIEKKTGLTLDATVEDTMPAAGVEVHEPAGIKPTERVYETNGALVFCDALFNLKEHLPGFSGLLMRLVGSTGYFGMTRIGKTFVASDARAFGGWLRTQSRREDVKAVLVAHGDAVVGAAACREALASAASRLGA